MTTAINSPTATSNTKVTVASHVQRKTRTELNCFHVTRGVVFKQYRGESITPTHGVVFKQYRGMRKRTVISLSGQDPRPRQSFEQKCRIPYLSAPVSDVQREATLPTGGSTTRFTIHAQLFKNHLNDLM
ncbi:unnamed protein product [Timema podura]|uniref:Uncharacterized protein n=1 Tax=Timema podura TaxID=61482 RepID=A0ABN7NER3_TIMPD|nr:unnamed protein product [Timema podura]